MQELETRRTTERLRIANSPPKVARACALLDRRRRQGKPAKTIKARKGYDTSTIKPKAASLALCFRGVVTTGTRQALSKVKKIRFALDLP